MADPAVRVEVTPRDIFALIVRVAGLGLVVAGVLDLEVAACSALGLPMVTAYAAGPSATAALYYVVPGVVLLVGARPITRWVYGRGP